MKALPALVIIAFGAVLLSGCTKQPVQGKLTSSVSFVIEPGMSIGPVRSGMTMQQVTEALGKPDRALNGVLEYRDLGLIILPAKDGLVSFVECMPPNGHGPPIKPFAGHTKEGIGIGARRADVISAYGEPTSVEHGDGYEILIYYPTPGINFHIKNELVNGIAVFFKQNH